MWPKLYLEKIFFKCTQQLWIWTLEIEVKYCSSSNGHKSAALCEDVWIHLLLYACIMYACLWKYVSSLLFSILLCTNYLSVCLSTLLSLLLYFHLGLACTMWWVQIFLHLFWFRPFYFPHHLTVWTLLNAILLENHHSIWKICSNPTFIVHISQGTGNIYVSFVPIRDELSLWFKFDFQFWKTHSLDTEERYSCFSVIYFYISLKILIIQEFFLSS